MKIAKRVNSLTRVNGLYSLELKKKGPRFSISKDRKKETSKYSCRKKIHKNNIFFLLFML